MTAKIKQGEESNLTKQDPTLRKVYVGVGWDIIKKNNEFALDSAEDKQIDLDLDVSAFLLNAKKTIRTETDFIFYNNYRSSDQSLIHTGDNTTGLGEGDDEGIDIDLQNMPFDVHYVVFVVSIYNAFERKHNFGDVKNAYIRIVNKETNEELVRYDLTEEYTDETGIIFGELYRIGAEWVFMAQGKAMTGGLAAIARTYDVNIRDE